MVLPRRNPQRAAPAPKMPAAALGEMQHCAFLLLPEFPLYGIVPAIEALRLANQNSGKKLYDWQLVSTDGKPVAAGNGMEIKVHRAIGDIPFAPLVIVCAGNHPLQHLPKAMLNWLRRLDRHGAVLGAIDTGAFALAEAGLLKNHVITLHWEAIPMFRSRYPEIDVREQLFASDGNRLTCAGGHAALDMMLDLIHRKHGLALAQIVANGFVSAQIRDETAPQRLSPRQLGGDDKSPFARIVRVMERHLAAPLSAEALVAKLGIDDRQLHRIVKESVGVPPMRYYLKLRLQAARNALFYSDTAIGDIALGHGFSTIEVFSRAFRTHFGQSPRAFRQSFSREQMKRFRPELEGQLAREKKRG